MADTEWNVTTITVHGSDDVSKCCDVVPKLADAMNLSLADEYIMDSGDMGWTYNIPSTSNLGLRFYYTPAAGGYFGIYDMYKTIDSWTTVDNNYVNMHPSLWVDGASTITVKSKKIGDYTAYILSSPSYCYMSGPSLVDYFTRHTYDHMSSSLGMTAYSDDLHLAKRLSYMNTGGGIYPTNGRSISVAAPVICYNDFCYGYIGSSSSLYGLSIGKTDVGTQIQIAGHTFESLGDAYWRLN